MQTLLTFSSIFLSLSTASGILIHDGHINQIGDSGHIQQVHDASAQARTDITYEAHPHPEHQGSTLNGFSYSSPSYPPRESKYKKFLLQNAVPRGRHAFDNSFLPLLV